MLTINFTDTMGPALQQAPQAIQRAVEAVVRQTADRVFQRIRLATPRDSGQAAAGWSQRTEGTGEQAKRTFVNTVPYINVLEFGGYPVTPARFVRRLPGIPRGNAVLDGAYPPGPRTQQALGGDPPMTSNVSRQAPQGMVRKNLAAARPEFLFNLEEAIDRALNSGAQEA